MKVAVMTGKKKMEWCEREVPQSGPGELQAKLEYVGMYGSDLHFYSEGCPTNWVPDGPLVLGHEPGGVISAVGEDVTGSEIGDRVTLEPGVPYGHYEDCLKGHYNLCRSVRFMAIPGEKGGVFSEYCTHTTSMTFKLPDNVSTMRGGLMEPLAVDIHACKLSNTKPGETAVVLGAGCIGFITLMSLKTRGVSEIYVVGALDKRLEKTRELGITRVLNSRNENTEEFARTFPGGGMDQIYEYVGNHITTLQTRRLIKRAGKITLMGASSEPVLELDITTLDVMEETIYSVYRCCDLYPFAVSAVSKRSIPLKKVVSHTFDFEDVIGGVDYSLSHKDEVIKAVIRI